MSCCGESCSCGKGTTGLWWKLKEDLQKWLDAKRKERDMLVQARRLSVEAGLKMNISDVEFQGDGRKATLYYTSGNSVDLKQLMRHHASAFRVKIELQSQR